MQINLTGFLTKDTPAFMNALWNLLLEAQTGMVGVPRSFLEQKKEETRKARENDIRALDERDRRARLDELNGDRGGRGGGDFRGRGRGGRGRGRGRGGFDDDRGGNRNRDSGWGNRGGGSGGGPSGVSISSEPFSFPYSPNENRILVDVVLVPHHAVVHDQSHLDALTLLSLQCVGIDCLPVVLLHLVTVVLVLVLAPVLALLYHQPTGDGLHHVDQVHPVDMLHHLLVGLHHLTVGGHGHHLLLLLVTESVVSKMLGRVEAHPRPDVVGRLQYPDLIPTADPGLLPASTLEGGVQALLQGKEV